MVRDLLRGELVEVVGDVLGGARGGHKGPRLESFGGRGPVPALALGLVFGPRLANEFGGEQVEGDGARLGKIILLACLRLLYRRRLRSSLRYLRSKYLVSGEWRDDARIMRSHMLGRCVRIR